MNKNKVISGLAAFGLAWGFPLGAQAAQTSTSDPKAEVSTLEQWWNGKYASEFFINNTFNSGRGLSANGFQWGGSYSAWGGYIKVKPIDWYYAQAGLYMAIPQGNVSANHGLDFQGFRPDPGLNGLYFLAESGFTPKFGSAKLPGRALLRRRHCRPIDR
jgi:hypothetical protein